MKSDWPLLHPHRDWQVTQLCTLFLGWRARTLWFASICTLHIVAMWACCAIWITCAHVRAAGCEHPTASHVDTAASLADLTVSIRHTVSGGRRG